MSWRAILSWLGHTLRRWELTRTVLSFIIHQQDSDDGSIHQIFGDAILTECVFRGPDSHRLLSLDPFGESFDLF